VKPGGCRTSRTRSPAPTAQRALRASSYDAPGGARSSCDRMRDSPVDGTLTCMSRLSWNEISARAAHFSANWADETYEKGESQSFWTQLLEVFRVDRRRAGGYFEYAVKLTGKRQGFIDVFLPAKLIVEQKSAGRDLNAARGQALGYLDGIADRDLPLAIAACDFQTFQFLDLDTRVVTSFMLIELAQHVRLFGFLVNEPIRAIEEQSPVNRDAAERMADLHQALYQSG